MPQISAVMECSKIAKKMGKTIIADGGIKFSGDLTKALALGANSVMIGNLLAGAEESPGETILWQGRTYKLYRGMGSLGAMALGSKDRYGQADIEDAEKLVPEGIEGKVPYKGSASAVIHQLVGGLKSGMGYVGARNIEELQGKARFVQISAMGLRESHVHDVSITKEAPNYRIEN
jgi:IMP dehydrogenase